MTYPPVVVDVEISYDPDSVRNDMPWRVCLKAGVEGHYRTEGLEKNIEFSIDRDLVWVKERAGYEAAKLAGKFKMVYQSDQDLQYRLTF